MSPHPDTNGFKEIDKGEGKAHFGRRAGRRMTMKQMRWLMMGCLLLGAGGTASGQVTNVLVETNGSRLVWAAMPGNPYRVYATPDMEEPIVWTNFTPDGLVFTDQQGFYDLSTGGYYCAMASDYLIVDLSGGPTAMNYPVRYTNSPPAGSTIIV
jgi:hypothetical protein